MAVPLRLVLDHARAGIAAARVALHLERRHME